MNALLITIIFMVSGYYLLWVHRSRQPVLITIWALFMAQCIIIIVQEFFFPGFGITLTPALSFLNAFSLMLFSVGHWIFSF
jgi:hypothetical protein